MKYKAVLLSHGGKIRTNNEDNAYLEEYYQKDDREFIWNYKTEKDDSMLAAVFDGMGGEEYGEIASRIAAECMSSLKNRQFSECVEFYSESTGKEIISYAKGVSMGTTYAAVSIENNVYWFSNLGDSRGYLWRDGQLKQMTRDHNIVQHMLQNGILTKEQAMRHPDRHSLYQFLGMTEDGEEIIPEPYQEETVNAKEKDLLLLCSDGLTDMLTEVEIKDILVNKLTVEEKGEALIQGALTNGGRDNVTIILIEVFKEAF